MSFIELKNEHIYVKINFKGAEISSFYNIKNRVEHIWQADPEVWARHAPILFPIVGQVKDGKYNVDGKQYSLGQHGFARDNEFELDEIAENKAVFKLKYNNDSLDIYPYKFCLKVIYTLENSKLLIEYIVDNIDDKDIYFSIGAHPGFTVPFNSDESFEDYYLEFNKPETTDILPLSESGLLNEKEKYNYLNESRVIKMTYETFKKNALIFENLKSETISIKSKKHNSELKVGIKDIPLLGIWTMPGVKAPYVCIEPWFGVTDSEYSTGDFKNKKAIQCLNVNASFKMDYFIEIT